ncbi:hypothetical protein MPH_01847 [Macrophomina phaseolina MS6]|uniref:Uncharacterized protein n=1 Tax=Macrophomina phaseolina (strain MS6) TaxID=1126212 RepID=K2SEJ6_MACPH|nr:hypothetical protein MPH_01847 [Macrophomina phaseolina MS6]
MSSSDDEDLQRAIAMSLGQLDCTPEDKAMPPAAIASRNRGGAPPIISSAEVTANSPNPPSNRSINEGLRRLDRRQLEAERLARQKARKHQAGPSASASSAQNDERPSKRTRTGPSVASSQAREVVDLTSPPRPSKATALSAGPHAPREKDSSIPTPPTSQSQGQAIRQILQDSLGISISNHSASASTTPSSVRITEPQYLDGAIKRTWAFGCPRDNDIKIEEVLQNHDLKSLILSTFDFDHEWFGTKVKLDMTRQLWIVGAANDDQRYEWSLAPAVYSNVELCVLDMKNGHNHGKFLIGSHPKYLRVAITTANLKGHDWGESGKMENTVFIIDLPRLPEGKKTSEDEATAFCQNLRFYLKSLNVGLSARDALLRFDWSRTRNLGFVCSLQGASIGDDGQRIGLPGLSQAIKELNLKSNRLALDYATSSLGALSRGFMKQFLTAAKGEELEATKEKYDADIKLGDLLKQFRVYFPTVDTVRASKGGEEAGGTIFLRKRWYDAPSFPKASMHDHKSTRNGILSHNKLIICRGQIGPEDEDNAGATEGKKVAWAYVGSHNFTQAAWGTLSRDKNTKTLKVNCRNNECGVIIPIFRGGASEQVGQEDKNAEEDGLPGYEVFARKMEIPFEIPGERYGNKKPWFTDG